MTESKKALDLTMGQKYMQHELRLTQDYINLDIERKVWARRGGYTMFYRKPEVQASFTACPFETPFSTSFSLIHLGELERPSRHRRSTVENSVLQRTS